MRDVGTTWSQPVRLELPGEAGAQVKAVYVLADEVFEVSCPLQLQQGHVSQAGTRVLKRGVKVRRLASLLHRPHSFRTSDEHKQHRDHKHALTEIQSLVLSFSQESFWVTSWKIESSLIFWNIGLDVLLKHNVKFQNSNPIIN